MMTLSEELAWRGFVAQTTVDDIKKLDDPRTFYLGMDPSADSLTIGNLAVAMLARQFIEHGYKAILLVGGATGLIGDPDGKKQERDLKTLDEIARNKAALAAQYQLVFAGKQFDLVDNYDWFKEIGYLEFLRDVGKHVPMRQMLGRDFVQSRLGQDGAGISYAEFSYSLIQGYDYLHLYREKGATLQLCGADQWGNCVTGVDLIRRVEGADAHVFSMPLVVNKTTGAKFGKSEAGAVWLDPAKTTPTQFYQFWINCDDAGVEDYLKLYTVLSKEEIEAVMSEQRAQPGARAGQIKLAEETTRMIHGEDELHAARVVTEVLTNPIMIGTLEDSVLSKLRQEISQTTIAGDGSILEALVATNLASSNTEARRFLKENAVSVNGQKTQRENFEPSDFRNGRLLLRRGKAFKDSALVELG